MNIGTYLLKKYVAFKRSLQPNKYLYNEVFDQYRFIFIHIPKTGGLSILSSLLNYDFTVGHKKAVEFRNFDRKRFNEYFKFAFVRNPLDRFFSAYSYLKKGGLGEGDYDFAKHYILPCSNFKEFVLSLNNPAKADKILRWKHFIPQYKFVCDENKQVIVDYIAKFENFEEEYDFIRKKLGMGHYLKHINASQKPDYHGYYDHESTGIIKSVYSEDFDLFGYN